MFSYYEKPIVGMFAAWERKTYYCVEVSFFFNLVGNRFVTVDFETLGCCVFRFVFDSVDPRFVSSGSGA